MSALTVDQGDDEVLDIAVTDPDSNPADLTDCELTWVVRPSNGSSVVLLSKTSGDGIEISGLPEEGLAAITLVPADTADLESQYLGREMVWELDAVDSVNKEVTLARGTIVINRDLVA